ncbi:MAG: hypothetical protein EA361_01465 [Bacteroidetes bacterium]|nr:MAG: hypothetical protein EA361_01465 [Bacteroidota bacterium]
MGELNSVLDFIKLVVVTTFSQLFWLLGFLFVFGLILYVFARFTRLTYVKSVGHKMDVIFTGWIGTPVHELGHAIFCIIFRHRIIEMKLYTPNSTDGTLGYVHHAYNQNSTYQRIGNFFIGVGPIIFGAVVLYAALYYLIPNRETIFSGIEAQSQTLMAGVQGDYSAALSSIRATTLSTLLSLFNTGNFSDFRFWIFLYLAICVASHMELSPPDIKGATGGLISLVIFFLFLNMLILGLEATGISTGFGSWWNYIKLENYAAGINKWVGTFGALFVFASVISGLNFLVSYILLSLYNIVKGKGLINPAW